jgi:hypothetical protein
MSGVRKVRLGHQALLADAQSAAKDAMTDSLGQVQFPY